ncbi:MAG: hypothetical protein Q9166_002526 [cf. Caloplaca sp. 2 TL-2023]
MADREPDRPLREITNQQARPSRRSPQRQQPMSPRRPGPSSENIPFRPLAPTPAQPQLGGLQYTSSSSASQPAPSIPPVPPSSPLNQQPGEDSSVTTIRIRLPHDFPPLEPICDFYMPLHFTWTRVIPMNDDEDPLLARMDALTEDIYDSLAASPTNFLLKIQYCRISEPTDSPYSDYDTPSYPPNEPEEVRYPKLLAIQTVPTQLHRSWREADSIIRGAIFRHFGTNFPLPIRYYYCHLDSGMMEDYGTSGEPSSALPSIDDMRIWDPRPAQSNELRNMGAQIGLKDGIRTAKPDKNDPNGTLGCYVRLKDKAGNVLPELFFLTNHHVVSRVNGDLLAPPPSVGKDPSPNLRREIAHPSIRDFENTTWTHEGRAANYQKLIDELEKDKSDDPTAATGILEYKIQRMKEEKERDEYEWAMNQSTGHKAMGTIWAKSGRTVSKVPSTFKTGNADKSSYFLADWALIKLYGDQEGQNLLPPAEMWPKRYPEAFDAVRAHRLVERVGTVRPGDLVGYAGRSGIHFGHVQRIRHNTHFQIVPHDSTTEVKVANNSSEVHVTGIDKNIPFAWPGDSGSAIFNTDGHFVGLFHSGNHLEFKERKCSFTPVDDLFEDIRRKTGYTVVWPTAIPPVDSTPPIPAAPVLSTHPGNVVGSSSRRGKGNPARGGKSSLRGKKGEDRGFSVESPGPMLGGEEAGQAPVLGGFQNTWQRFKNRASNVLSLRSRRTEIQSFSVNPTTRANSDRRPRLPGSWTAR